jgi:sugar phosphate isomerase/epimerase
MQMEIATALTSFRNTGDSMEQAIERCARAGFTALDFNYVGDHPITARIWDRDVDELRTLGTKWGAHAEQAGVPFRQMHGPIFNPLASKEAVDVGIRRTIGALEFSAALGAKWVVMHVCTTPPVLMSHNQRLQINIDFFTPLVMHAATLGVGIAFENAADPSVPR